MTLTEPGGESVTVSRAMPVVQNDRFYAQLRQDGSTFVLVDKPAAGEWTLTDDGTAPVRLVREARGLPEAAARVTVKGKGRARVLGWNALRIPGQRITFSEVGKDVRNAIHRRPRRRSVRFGRRTLPAVARSSRWCSRAVARARTSPPGPIAPRGRSSRASRASSS